MNQNHYHVFPPDWTWYKPCIEAEPSISHDSTGQKERKRRKCGNCYVKMSGQIFPSMVWALLIMDPKSPLFCPFTLPFRWLFRVLASGLQRRCLEGTVNFYNRRVEYLVYFGTSDPLNINTYCLYFSFLFGTLFLPQNKKKIKKKQLTIQNIFLAMMSFAILAIMRYNILNSEFQGKNCKESQHFEMWTLGSEEKVKNAICKLRIPWKKSKNCKTFFFLLEFWVHS